MTIEIRNAIETEISTLLSFEKGIIESERPFDNTLKEGDIHYYDLLELIKSENAEVLVGKRRYRVRKLFYLSFFPIGLK